MAKTKIFHSRIPNSTFVCQLLDSNGAPMAGRVEVLQFKGNTLEVEDPVFIAQLEGAADRPGSTIYTVDASAVLKDANIPADQVKQRAATIVEQIAATGNRPA